MNAVTDEMVEAALDAHVVGACPVIEYLDFNASDAKEMGVSIEGENFAGLDIIRHEQWRDAGRAIMRAALTDALSIRQGGVKALDVDELAQEIRRVDGNNELGAGALAEALLPFLSSPAQEIADKVVAPEFDAMFKVVEAVMDMPQSAADQIDDLVTRTHLAVATYRSALKAAQEGK